ncbi:uncharacterized protein LOC105159683 isoform X1 [Sesamum indicum]|uniref:Uncharacterized protein LOC105159683 isoform X1 n=1 Tax=Sesamum indicum TaxID=4182 RepID=A0A6I9SZR9_SESIN|nr:uncharacterized protein LOC105159683 isoform X1 [Sesamum indicum]
MNKTSRIAATINSQSNPFPLRASLFHSTPVFERRRRTHWDSASSFRSSPRKFNQYTNRLRKQNLLRNVSEFADHLFQSWQSDRDDCDQPSGRGSSWFRPSFRDDGYKKGKSRYRASQASRRDFEFCNDDDDVEFETIFRSAFGGNRYFYWSFTTDDEPRYRNSSSYSSNYRTSTGWKYHYEDEYDSSSEYEKPMADLTSDRLALGLSASGPINLEDVKNAYRACALKWHPDRHQGSSKVVAEEKFKACSAAYQSLCNKLALQ